jgi:hypothetical protein
MGGNGRRAVQALEPQQVATVVHYGDGLTAQLFLGFGLGRSGMALISENSSWDLVFMPEAPRGKC